eukprot:6742600-Alexandrium_andersonii.AAC.1
MPRFQQARPCWPWPWPERLCDIYTSLLVARARAGGCVRTSGLALGQSITYGVGIPYVQDTESD